ncbi:MAG: Cna B-type domain-containing protein, partial [Clostridia bacterium]|nr:Cna B-type domain-containing protein [Clostridia bacterium]
LEGATIQILDKEGNVVDEWVSKKDETHVVEGLKTGEEYTLHETVAPEGYTVTTDTTFTIDETGKVTSTGTISKDETTGKEVLLVEDAKTHIEVSKVDVADGEELEGATIQILDKEGNVVDEWVSKKDETHVVEGLKTGEEYTLHETVAPEGYTVTTDTTFTIDETGKVTSTGTISKDETTGKEVLLVEDAKTHIEVSKVDVTDGTELDGATIQILDKEGNVVDEWVSNKDEAHVVEGLKTEEVYTLRETTAPEGFEVTVDTVFILNTDGTFGTVTEGEKNNTTIRNDGVLLVEDMPTQTRAVVKKAWVDGENRDNVRPQEIKVTLLADGGNELTLADGTKTTFSIMLNRNNNWSYVYNGEVRTNAETGAQTMIGLREYKLNADGTTTKIVYTWAEDVTGLPEGYSMTSNETNGILTVITNTYGPETTKITVNKVWEDSGIEGLVHESVRVQLYADGTAIKEPVVLDDSNNWTYTWDGLYTNVNVNGAKTAIAYTVEEINVPNGYKSNVTQSGKTFTITNTYQGGKLAIEKTFKFEEPEPEIIDHGATVDVPIIKIWNDGNNRDGSRPASITVRLLANGVEVASAQVMAQSGWVYIFTGMPKFDDEGKTITYTVLEDAVARYKTDIYGLTIQNTYQPEVTSATIRKIWDDNGNETQQRPDSIYMVLSNGLEDVATVILSVENNWTATIDNLPVYVNGNPVTYKWTEQTVRGYDRTGFVTNGTVTEITNTLWQHPEEENRETGAKRPGNKFYVFEEYETPLGVEIMINHVGDCFD